MLPGMQTLGISIVWELALAIALAIGISFRQAELVDKDEVQPVQEGVQKPREVKSITQVKQVAAGTAEILSQKPQAIAVPSWLAQKVTGRTAIYYVSPTCSHCQDRVPEITTLVEKGGMTWLGVASNQATQSEVDFYKTEFKAPFPLVIDDGERGVGDALGVTNLPSVYVLEPAAPGSGAKPNTVVLISKVAPFHPGNSRIFAMREDPTNPFKDFTGYVGPATCGSCHTQEMNSWGLTHHSVAYRTIQSREKHEDPKCVSCHVTGLGLEGGFVLGDHESHMQNVTCEACHGPGGPHNPTAKKVDAKAACVGCHDADHSIAFSVEKGLPHIDHFMAVGLDKRQWRDKKLALLRGEAPKPLLAFPDGPSAGSKACKSCHGESHKSWKSAPHGRAMASLTLEQRTDVACVRCHATPKMFGGPAPKSISAFRVEESVGCESCHGAGTDHIASPGKDNIVGLGSSCPECVIEAVCTTCHTPKWDKGWNLETRLQAAKHP